MILFNDTATTEIYPLSLHDALPISRPAGGAQARVYSGCGSARGVAPRHARSEEHTAELQSRQHLVCRLLLGKKRRLFTQRHRIAKHVTAQRHGAARLLSPR